MKIKNIYKLSKSGLLGVLLCCCTLLLFTSPILAQQPSANLDQVRNGSATSPISPADWVNGNAGQQNAHFIEGYSIPYRVVMENLEIGVPIEIVFEFDATASQSNEHAIDFITYYDNLEPHSPFQHAAEEIDPLQDVTGVPDAPVYATIPAPCTNGSPIPGEPATTFNALDPTLQRMTLYGGTFAATLPVEYTLCESLALSNAQIQFTVRFTPTSTTAVLLWGGHIATQTTWGPGNSASAISGSPYHMRLISWNLGNLGNQDRSMSAVAVYIVPPCSFSGDGVVCLQTVHTYSIDTVTTGATYAWSIQQNGTNAFFVGGVNTGTSVQVNSGTLPGTFTLTVVATLVDADFTTTKTCSEIITVNPGPSCDILGVSSVCPNVTETYTGPVGNYTYAWSISGNGSISGPTDGQSVDVISGGLCNAEFVLTLTVTENGCSNTCTENVMVGRVIPLIIACPEDVGIFDYLPQEEIDSQFAAWLAGFTYSGGCNAVPSSLLGYTPPDNSGGFVEITFTVTDDCGSVECSSLFLVQIALDVTLTCPEDPNLGPCSTPEEIQLAYDAWVAGFTYSTVCLPVVDNLDQIPPLPVLPECDGIFLEFTYIVTDDCDITDSCTATFTVAPDDLAPVISGVGADYSVECPAVPVFSEPSASDLCDASPLLTFEDVTTPGDCPQEYSVTRTWTATDDCLNSSTASQTITVEDNTAPELVGVPADIDALCGEEIEIPYPTASDACDGDVDVEFSRSDGGAWGDPFLPGTTTTICFWASDDCGNTTDNQCMTVTVAECIEEYCTLTQGAYGNEGGTFCNGMGTVELLNSLLAQGNLVVGSNGNTMTFYPGEAACIIQLLPGGGPAKTITGFNTCASHPGIQMKNGRIHNILLAQTITLSLNLRLSSDLGDLEIFSNILLTASSSGCDEEGDIMGNDWVEYPIPLSVYNVLSQNGTIVPTVNDLLALANLGLGGGYIGATTLSAIADALDAINRGFDECRFGYFQDPQQAGFVSGPGLNNGSVNELELVTLSSYPNPFNSTSNISFTVPVTGHVRLEVYTLTGMKIQTLYDNSAEAEVEYNVEFNGQSGINQATYICVITTSYGTKYSRLMMIR